MQNENKNFIRIQATAEEKAEMRKNCIRIGRFGYEEYEDLADKAKSREEYDFYTNQAHWAFKSAEALVFGP